MVAQSEQQLANLLAELRREGRQQSGLAEALVPPDQDSAYRVAAQVAALLGWAHAGWKVAATKTEMQRALRTTSPIYGRMFAPFVYRSPAALTFATLVHPVAECEYVIELGADLPPRSHPYTQAEVRDAVKSISPGIEVAQCRFTADANFPALTAILADGSGSGCVVMGEPIPDWQDRDIADQEIVLRVDGTDRRRGSAREALEHPLVPLTWLANELSRTGIGLRAGEIFSSGTCTGMLRARPGETHVADFGAFGDVRVGYST